MRCVFGSSDGWPHRLTHGSELRRALDTVARSHGISDLSRQTGVTRAGIYKALGEDGTRRSR